MKAWSACSRCAWPFTLASLAEAPSSFDRVHHCSIGNTSTASYVRKKEPARLPCGVAVTLFPAACVRPRQPGSCLSSFAALCAPLMPTRCADMLPLLRHVAIGAHCSSQARVTCLLRRAGPAARLALHTSLCKRSGIAQCHSTRRSGVFDAVVTWVEQAQKSTRSLHRRRRLSSKVGRGSRKRPYVSDRLRPLRSICAPVL